MRPDNIIQKVTPTMYLYSFHHNSHVFRNVCKNIKHTSFKQAVSVWNVLPDDTVTAHSLPVFKHKHGIKLFSLPA